MRPFKINDKITINLEYVEYMTLAHNAIIFHTSTGKFTKHYENPDDASFEFHILSYGIY